MEIFNFGENLRKIRVSKGIKQEAMVLKLDITQTKYSRIERGKELPHEVFISLAAEYLGVKPKELMPPGWDQLKTVKVVNSLTRTGVIAYRLLLASLAYDMTRGFYDGGAVVSEPAKVAVAAFFGIAVVVFDYYTEKQITVEG